MGFISKVELKRQLQALGAKVEGNYVKKSEINKFLIEHYSVTGGSKEQQQQLITVVNFLKKNPPKEAARKALDELSNKLMHGEINKKDPSVIEALDDMEFIFKKYESDQMFKKPIMYLRSLVA